MVETNAVVEAKIVGEGGAVEVGVKIGKCAVLGRVCGLSGWESGKVGVIGIGVLWTDVLVELQNYAAEPHQ